MIKFVLLLITMSAALTTSAQKLSDYRWENRVILIFGNDQQAVSKQKEVFDAKKKDLEERDLRVFVNPETKEMQKLRRETGFEVILIGKTGISLNLLASPIHWITHGEWHLVANLSLKIPVFHHYTKEWPIDWDSGTKIRT